jgi:hypothetical protein
LKAKRKMSLVRSLLTPFKWMFMSERQLVDSLLTVSEIKPFSHPAASPLPTVDITTRYPLESIRDIKLNGYYPGLSNDARSLVLEAFRSVVRERVYAATFPMSQLHGFKASKSTMSENRNRVLQVTMAGMGALVDDLDDLKGLSGPRIIDACMAWKELRINQGIRLYTDNWHRRFYWGNEGGSHHMSVLCYQLQKQGREWTPVVEVYEEVLDVEPLNKLTSKISIFVVMNENGVYGRLFNSLPGRMQQGEIQKKLGVTRVLIGSRWAANQYALIVVDHSREYSDLSLVRLNVLVESGRAMRFQDFLMAWKGHGAPDTAPI